MGLSCVRPTLRLSGAGNGAEEPPTTLHRRPLEPVVSRLIGLWVTESFSGKLPARFDEGGLAKAGPLLYALMHLML